MWNKHENYGTYYGELISLFGGSEKLGDLYVKNDEDVNLIIKALQNAKVVEAFFDVSDEVTDTIFFKIDETTNLKDLMVWVANKWPNEFDEISPNHFRMWFD